MKSIALVIGGTSGIGLETATRLEASVDQVIVVGRTVEHLASAHKKLGASAKVERIDLYDWKQVQEFCKKMEESTDRIQYLVNAPGTFVPKSFLDHGIEAPAATQNTPLVATPNDATC